MSGAKSGEPDPAANLPVNAVTMPNEREEQQSAASVRLWLLDKLVGLWAWWKFG